MPVVSGRADVNDPSRPIRTGLRSCQESREKELRKVEMSYKAPINPHTNDIWSLRPTKGISTELKVIALSCHIGNGRRHNTGIVIKNVKSRLFPKAKRYSVVKHGVKDEPLLTSEIPQLPP
jgi:hypothetical protein